jgi:hypothetical protein
LAQKQKRTKDGAPAFRNSENALACPLRCRFTRQLRRPILAQWP